MKTEYLNVTGMTCGGCVSSLTRALKMVAGVSDVQVELSTGKTTVQYDDNLALPEQIKQAVENAGYGVEAI